MRGTRTQRSPGVWRLRVFVGSDASTGNPRQVSRTIKGTKEQADTALAGFLAEVMNGTAPVAGTATLDEYLHQWLDHITPTRSPATVRGYRFKVKRISTKLGRVRLDKLTAQQLDRTYREWLNEGLDPSTVHHLHRVLSAALRQAVKWGLLFSAPTARASPPQSRLQPKPIPSPSVIQDLIAAAEDRGQPVLAAAIALAATTGLRRGELAGLRWTDIDFVAGRLHVRRAIKNDLNGAWIAGPPKSHQARRVALDAFTVAVLREQLRRSQQAAEAAVLTLDPDGYILTLDATGVTPIRPDTLTQAFRRVCRAAGVSDVTMHTLRHFSASMLIASGRDVRTIAGRLGHSDASTTLRVYAHMVEGRDQDAADFLGGLLATRQPSRLIGAVLRQADTPAPFGDAVELHIGGR
jgi:integrase